MASLAGATAQNTERVWTNPDKELFIVNETFMQRVDSVVVVKDGKGVIAGRFWDNWFLSVGGGGQVYFGEQDSHGKFFNRVTPVAEISLGKWLHPVYGLRAQFGFSGLKGYTTAPDPTTSGSPDSDGYYTQKWKQIYVSGQFMLNLSNAIWGYKPDRVYNLVPFIGAEIAWAKGLSGNGKDRSPAFVFGILNNFRVCKNFDIFLELKDHVIQDDYDFQVVKGADNMLAVTVGLTWNIGKYGGCKFRNSKEVNTYITRIYKPEVQIIKETVIEERGTTGKGTSCSNASMAIFFEFGSATITPRGKLNIANAAEMIKNSDGKFTIVGMADSQTGSAKVNAKLSGDRAEAARKMLVDSYGVPADRLVVKSLGGVDYNSPDYVNRAVIISPAK